MRKMFPGSGLKIAAKKFRFCWKIIFLDLEIVTKCPLEGRPEKGKLQ
jgi:hypothetical protein